MEVAFQDLQLSLPANTLAQVKHCRIAWKPLIPAGCYTPSARLEVKGHFWKAPDSARIVLGQLRLSHDVLGQGGSSPVKSVELAEGVFTSTIELPPERFQQAWDEVKLV